MPGTIFLDNGHKWIITGGTYSTDWGNNSSYGYFGNGYYAWGDGNANFTASMVTPEPATLTLFGTGLVGIAGLIKKRLLSKV